jgi:anti-sigma B factor antagonist
MAGDEDFSDIEPLRIEAIRHRTEVTIIVDGHLDAATSPRFRESVKEVLASRPRSMAIDASRVTFVDSSGLGALLSARHAVRTEAGLAFRVIDPSPALLHVVEMAGFMELLVGE